MLDTIIGTESKNYCPKCNMTELTDEAKFCSSCGTKLTVKPVPPVCKYCGQTNRLGANFCVYCGITLLTLI
jgi:uncharacterized membrane protein YvbJ